MTDLGLTSIVAALMHSAHSSNKTEVMVLCFIITLIFLIKLSVRKVFGGKYTLQPPKAVPRLFIRPSQMCKYPNGQVFLHIWEATDCPVDDILYLCNR